MEISGYINDLAALLPLNRRSGRPCSLSGYFGEGINAISLLVMDPQLLSCPVIDYNILPCKEVSLDIIFVLNCIS
jgi:hypothetical protein